MSDVERASRVLAFEEVRRTRWRSGEDGEHLFFATSRGARDFGRGAAQDVNERGMIAGHAWITGGPYGTVPHAALWTARGDMRDFGTLGGRFSYARLSTMQTMLPDGPM